MTENEIETLARDIYARSMAMDATVSPEQAFALAVEFDAYTKQRRQDAVDADDKTTWVVKVGGEYFHPSGETRIVDCAYKFHTEAMARERAEKEGGTAMTVYAAKKAREAASAEVEAEQKVL